MAANFVPNTAFELRVSNHIWDKQKNITGLYQNSATPELCPAGFLVQETTQIPNEGYTGLNNENAWFMKTAADATQTIYACNTFNVNEIQDPVTGNIYKVGSNTLGLPIPAGQRGTYTRIDEGDMMRFGVGNFTAAPEANKYAVIANGMLTAQAEAPTAQGTLYFEVLSTGSFTQGAYASFAYYLLRAKRVRTTA